MDKKLYKIMRLVIKPDFGAHLKSVVHVCFLFCLFFQKSAHAEHWWADSIIIAR